MTQNDLDNGRLICLVGIAPVRPAEFVILRFEHATTSSPSSLSASPASWSSSRSLSFWWLSGRSTPFSRA